MFEDQEEEKTQLITGEISLETVIQRLNQLDFSQEEIIKSKEEIIKHYTMSKGIQGKQMTDLKEKLMCKEVRESMRETKHAYLCPQWDASKKSDWNMMKGEMKHISQNQHHVSEQEEEFSMGQS